MTAPVVTVYTSPLCPGCQLTKKHLERRGIAFVEEPAADHVEAVLALGYRSAPVVCVNVDGVESHWGGYRPDRIDALAGAR